MTSKIKISFERVEQARERERQRAALPAVTETKERNAYKHTHAREGE
jgi:hypothetical protein